VTTQATPFSLVYRLEATLPIEFEVESFKVVISSHLTDSQSLRNRLIILEELDEKRQMGLNILRSYNAEGISPSTNGTKNDIEARYDGDDSRCQEIGILR
jgi:hypothetical protein